MTIQRGLATLALAAVVGTPMAQQNPQTAPGCFTCAASQTPSEGNRPKFYPRPEIEPGSDFDDSDALKPATAAQKRLLKRSPAEIARRADAAALAVNLMKAGRHDLADKVIERYDLWGKKQIVITVTGVNRRPPVCGPTVCRTPTPAPGQNP
jgi:hypothetical protein